MRRVYLTSSKSAHVAETGLSQVLPRSQERQCLRTPSRDTGREHAPLAAVSPSARGAQFVRALAKKQPVSHLAYAECQADDTAQHQAFCRSLNALAATVTSRVQSVTAGDAVHLRLAPHSSTMIVITSSATPTRPAAPISRYSRTGDSSSGSAVLPRR